MTRKLSVGSFRSSGGQNFRARRTYGGENRFSKDFDSDLFIYFLILMEGRRPVRHRTNRRRGETDRGLLVPEKVITLIGFRVPGDDVPEGTREPPLFPATGGKS